MELLRHIKEDFIYLARGRPGRRFRDFQNHKKEERGKRDLVVRGIYLAIGLILIVGGLAIGWLPGPGGFIAIIGLAFLARVIPGVAKYLDYCEVLGRRLWAWFQRRPAWMRMATYLLVGCAAASMMWLTGSYVFR